MKQFLINHNGRIFLFSCQDIVDGIAIDPVLPDNFDGCPNDKRPARHMAWWGVPFIRRYSEANPKYQAEFLESWPEGVRYDVRCLNGGAWDRSTGLAQCKTLAEALDVAKQPVADYGV